MTAPIDPALLWELFEHNQRGYGPWTSNMRRRVEEALGVADPTTHSPWSQSRSETYTGCLPFSHTNACKRGTSRCDRMHQLVTGFHLADVEAVVADG